MPYPNVMEVPDYEDEVTRTANRNWYDPALGARVSANLPLLNFSLGVAGEAGELADAVKKHVFHGHMLDRDHLIKEVGDIIWYAAAIGLTLGMPLQEVLEANIEKLRKRYPEGFSEKASQNRAENQATLRCLYCNQSIDACRCINGSIGQY